MRLRDKKANELETCDKDDGPACSHIVKCNVVASPPKKRFSNKRRTSDIDRIFTHTRTRAMNGLHIEDEESHV